MYVCIPFSHVRSLDSDHSLPRRIAGKSRWCPCSLDFFACDLAAGPSPPGSTGPQRTMGSGYAQFFSTSDKCLWGMMNQWLKSVKSRCFIRYPSSKRTMDSIDMENPSSAYRSLIYTHGWPYGFAIVCPHFQTHPNSIIWSWLQIRCSFPSLNIFKSTIFIKFLGEVTTVSVTTCHDDELRDVPRSRLPGAAP